MNIESRVEGLKITINISVCSRDLSRRRLEYEAGFCPMCQRCLSVYEVAGSLHYR
jgi:hypothetical protein